MQHIVILGCGYVGSRFARFSRLAGSHVTIITRSAARVDDLQLADRVIQYDWSQPNPSRLLAEPIDTLLCSVSHRVETDSSGNKSNIHTEGLENILTGFSKLPNRIVYLSTTGVYASSNDGDWIDETSSCQPDRPGAQNALDAEQWLSANVPNSSVILRPAGIYGPDRIPNLSALRAGEPIAANPDSYLNLIHVDDLVQVIDRIACATTVPHTHYNVADGSPVLRCDYYSFLTNKLHAPAPVFAPGKESTTAIRTRGQGSKRIDTSRLNRDFLIPWLYPDYKAGLTPLLAAHVATPNR